jgi:amino acid transporter
LAAGPSVLTIAKTVCWSFFGVRRRVQHEEETVNIKPLHVIVAGIIGAALFVISLLVLVRFITSAAAQ